MKLYKTNWRIFFQGLQRWETLPEQARKLYLEAPLNDALRVSPRFFDPYLQTLLDTQLIEIASKEEMWVQANQTFIPFFRIMNELNKRQLFPKPHGHGIVLNYITNLYSKLQIEKIYRPTNSRSQFSYADTIQHFSSLDYLNEFLELTEWKHWEASRLTLEETGVIQDQTVFSHCQFLLRSLLDQGKPIAFTEARGRLPNLSDQQFHQVLQACFRYFLVIADLCPQTFMPQLGVWPNAVRQHQNRQVAITAGEATQPSFEYPFTFDDMTMLMRECVSEPPRLRTQDHQIYAIDTKKLNRQLIELPCFMKSMYDGANNSRLNFATTMLKALGLVKINKEGSKEHRLVATQKGLDWLQMPAKQRLQSVLAILHLESSLYSGNDTPIVYDLLNSLCQSYVYLEDHLNEECIAWLQETFKQIPQDRYVTMKSFLKYCAVNKNPFLIKRPTRPIFFWQMVVRPDDEQFENLFYRLLLDMLINIFIRWGGISLSLQKDDLYLLKMTEIGRYILGEIDDFEFSLPDDQQIVVQPNFEVVFLEPSSHAEARLGAFAERIGNGMGSLFRITPKSIKKAASKGLSAEEILETLRTVSSKALPKNVEHEIKEWHGQVRKVQWQSGFIIRCPDAETAHIVLSAAGKKAEALTDTVVLCTDMKIKATLRKTLHKKGIFITSV